jgi:hypothetical protein
MSCALRLGGNRRQYRYASKGTQIGQSGRKNPLRKSQKKITTTHFPRMQSTQTGQAPSLARVLSYMAQGGGTDPLW